MGYTIDSTVREIMNDERARAVVERHVPGATRHPQLSEVMSMTLGEVASYPAAGISRMQLQAMLDDLAKLETEA